MEENTDSKRRITPTVPANYVSIVDLRERWIKEKERQRNEQEEEERRRKQHAEEQQKVEEEEEEDLIKPDVKDKQKDQSDQNIWGRNSKNDESIDGGEARCGGEKDEETAAIRNERGEDEGLPEKKRGRRKRYDRKTKKKRENQEVVAVVDESVSIEAKDNTAVKDQIRVYRKKVEKAIGSREKAIETQLEHLSIERGQETVAIRSQRGEDEELSEKKRGRRKRYDGKKKKRENQEVVAVVDECGSIEAKDNTAVKDQIRVYRKKEEKTMGNKSVEKAVTAIETQFEHLSIKSSQETKNLKAQRRYDLPLGRVRMPKEIAAMVWVKKGQDERAGDGIGSGVKPLNA